MNLPCNSCRWKEGYESVCDACKKVEGSRVARIFAPVDAPKPVSSPQKAKEVLTPSPEAKKPRKKPYAYEHMEQKALFAWCQVNEGRVEALKNIFAIPNGGHRDIRVARKLQAEGVKRGVPDIFLAYPWGGLHGLWIEMKAGKNKPTPDQEAWHYRLRARGYQVKVCYSAQEAQKVIMEYLGMG